MLFSLRCLNTFIDVEEFFQQPEKLKPLLTLSGTETEGFEEAGKAFQNFRVAQVREKKPHPRASRLQLCRADTGGGKICSVVCGADNFQVGDKVVLAPPGSTLPGGLKIKARKIRDQLSEGMFLSLEELGLSSQEKSSGIVVLSPAPLVQTNFFSPPVPVSAKVGESLASFLGLEDKIFKINITPNRGDLLSHFGMARELSFLLNRPLKFPEGPLSHLHSAIKNPSLKEKKTELLKNEVRISVKSPSCSLYTGGGVRNLKVKASPLWLKCRLQSLGMKSINNVVDCANYTMIQWGQPFHTFDMDRLPEKSITIDLAKEGEKMLALDKTQLCFQGGELLVRSGKEAVALAGVMGGLNSSVQNDTQNVFVESACFLPSLIRSSSKKFHLETDSAYRFARFVPKQMCLFSLKQCLELIHFCCGGSLTQDSQVEPETSQRQSPCFSSAPPPALCLREKDLLRLGFPVPFKDFISCMKNLGCKVLVPKDSPESVQIQPPFFRPDLQIKEDLMEEYARLRGYQHIPEKFFYVPPQKGETEYQSLLEVKKTLSRLGFYQALNHSFYSQEYAQQFLGSLLTPHYTKEGGGENQPTTCQPVFIQNPLSREMNLMRTSLVPSLFKNAQKDIHSGTLYGRLFEQGKVFFKSPVTETKKTATKNSHSFEYREESRLALAAWGQSQDFWHSSQKQRSLVFDLKSVVSELLRHFFISGWEWKKPASPPPFLHPRESLALFLKNQFTGFIGSLHPAHFSRYKIPVPVALAEINLGAFLTQKSPKKKIHDPHRLSPFPQVERDMAFVLPKNIPLGDLLKDLRKHAGPLCRSVHIFDIYEKQTQEKEEHHSVAFRFVLRSQNKTLTEKDLKSWQKHLEHKVLSQWKIQIRS